ncbi:MAG: methytransferase partner Trm112 [Thermoplasmata archaeon]|nr:methytransferase partner Trm112 [Thermoplasmata archaeon]
MKHEMMDILCCPVCKSDLELKVDEEKAGEILQGTLTCKKCDHGYKIEDSIPNLLPP